MDRRELARRQREERRALADRQRRRRAGRSNILDEPVPEISVPILKPAAPRKSNPQSLKKLSEKVAAPIRKEINKFADWITSYAPVTIKNP